MSSITFHHQGDEPSAELRGTERAYFGHLCTQMLNLSLGLNDSYVRSDENHWLTALLPRTSYVQKSRGMRQLDELRTLLAIGFSDRATIALPDGRTTDPFNLSLNTALRAGGDALKLAARLHGQCEIHCWVDGPNRAWLAGIIERGVKDGIFRDDQGWDGVIALLRLRDDGPVVCSYSVCESFPNASIAMYGGWEAPEDDEDNEAWYNLSHEEQWSWGMKALRENSEQYRYSLELRPDTWDGYITSAGISGWDLARLAPNLARD